MTSTSAVRVYMACSLDGFIAGPENDLAWLEAPRPPGDLPADARALAFDAFMAQTGCLLMGRTTYDTVQGFGLPTWPYGDTPTLVATHRTLVDPPGTVSAIAGTITELIAAARARAGTKDVYLDGGNLVQQALNAGLVDELIITTVPILLGSGTRIFEHLTARTTLQFTAHHAMPNGMVQLHARVLRA